jgi:hypothetical protein
MLYFIFFYVILCLGANNLTKELFMKYVIKNVPGNLIINVLELVKTLYSCDGRVKVNYNQTFDVYYTKLK